MGTPEFAVVSLKRLAQSRHSIVGVVTVPDKPAGRGLKLQPSAVKHAAMELNIPILQPEKLKEPDFLSVLQQWQADCYAVVAFRILPAEVFSIPKHGTVNLHSSLLPQYRGAAPIQWAIMNGERETGVTTFLIDQKMDTGDILMQRSVPIFPDENAESLHDRLADQGADLLVETMNLFEEGKLTPRPQCGKTTPAPKITPAHCRIEWSNTGETIHNQIRALSPAPGAFTAWNDRRVKLLRADLHAPDAQSRKDAGTLLRADVTGIFVQCGRGQLMVHELQLEGKKRLSAAEFLRGTPLRTGDRFISP
jgi:methionyl-tRNA formyltransferase